MKGQLFFEIPQDTRVRTQLVFAIPDHWSRVSGRLIVPKGYMTLGLEAPEIGFSLGYDSNYLIVCPHRNRPDPVNLVGLIARQKLPSFVDFDNAGHLANEHSTLTLGIAKRVAIALLHHGYQGYLTFTKEDHRRYVVADVNFAFQPFEGGESDDEPGDQPPRIKINTFQNPVDKEELVDPIILACRQLNLREYNSKVAA